MFIEGVVMSQRLNHSFTRRYVELAQSASVKEKSGQWVAAAEIWEQAARAARLPENLLWARSRTQYCEHQAGMVRKGTDRLMTSEDLKSLASALVSPKHARSPYRYDDE